MDCDKHVSYFYRRSSSQQETADISPTTYYMRPSQTIPGLRITLPSIMFELARSCPYTNILCDSHNLQLCFLEPSQSWKCNTVYSYSDGFTANSHFSKSATVRRDYVERKYLAGSGELSLILYCHV